MANLSTSNPFPPQNAKNSSISFHRNEKLSKILELCRKQKKVLSGCYSYCAMHSAGFEYTDKGDAARCSTCGLEVSGVKLDMKPFAIHKQRSPMCPFVLSISPASDTEEQSLQQTATGTTGNGPSLNKLIEVEILKKVRKRGFSHWPYRSSPSAAQIIKAGFFNCNVGDRVICIYCNLICQRWTPNSDDPCEIHKTLSPKCPYVTGILLPPQTMPTLQMQINSSSNDPQQTTASLNKTAIHKRYIEPKKRLVSFTKWCDDNLPSVDDLVRAGFFYTGVKTIVTCFYCNGSLQNWGANSNPMIEHARWFPHCAYAKQLCGVELHRQIQESKRAQQDKTNTRDENNTLNTNDGNSIGQPLPLLDEDMLPRMAIARLDLPVSISMRNGHLKLAIIKKCWEDQLRLNGDDFVTDCDLLVACIIVQKQVKYINGNTENIIVPSVAMRKIRDQERAADNRLENQTTKIQAGNPCILCSEEERCLACIPCGHLITCTLCSEVYRLCPVCHVKIDAFVRIYH